MSPTPDITFLAFGAVESQRDGCSENRESEKADSNQEPGRGAHGCSQTRSQFDCGIGAKLGRIRDGWAGCGIPVRPVHCMSYGFFFRVFGTK